MKDLTSTQTITVTVDNPTKVNNVIYTGSYNSGYANRSLKRTLRWGKGERLFDHLTFNCNLKCIGTIV